MHPSAATSMFARQQHFTNLLKIRCPLSESLLLRKRETSVLQEKLCVFTKIGSFSQVYANFLPDFRVHHTKNDEVAL